MKNPGVIPDILPQLKHVGFSLLLRFSSSSLTVMTVLREPITEFWCLSSPESCASVGITDPHACIPVCMQWGYAFCPFLCQDCRTETFPTSCRSPSRSITAWGIFMHDFLMIFHRSSFMPEFQCHCEIYRFTFIPRLKPWAFCLNDRNQHVGG